MAQPKENGKQLVQQAARAMKELDVSISVKKLAYPYKMLQSLIWRKTSYNYQEVPSVPLSFVVW